MAVLILLGAIVAVAYLEHYVRKSQPKRPFDAGGTVRKREQWDAEPPKNWRRS